MQRRNLKTFSKTANPNNIVISLQNLVEQDSDD